MALSNCRRKCSASSPAHRCGFTLTRHWGSERRDRASENGRVRRVAVARLRIKSLLGLLELQLDRLVAGLAGGHRAVEAGAVADMAGGVARDLHPQPDRVLVVVDAQLDDLLHEARGGALVPQHLAAAAVIMGLAGLDGAPQGFLVHVAQHQHFAAVGVRGDTGQQAVGVEFRRQLVAFLDLFHGNALGEHGVTPGGGRRVAARVALACRAVVYRRVARASSRAARDATLNALYNDKILSLAAQIGQTERLADPDATVTHHSPLCGSRITVDLKLTDGRVTAYGQQVRACALGQAAASILGRTIIGQGTATLRRLGEALRAARKSAA